MGRAARNVNGRAILYADKITGSMERAIGETERRRNKQLEHNEEHDITPKSVTKKVADIMEGARSAGPGAAKGRKGKAVQQLEIPDNPKALGKLMAQLEKQMLKHAQDLEFEQAAQVRDQLQSLRAQKLLS